MPYDINVIIFISILVGRAILKIYNLCFSKLLFGISWTFNSF